MDFNEYSDRALATSLNKNKNDLLYPILGMIGELGEFCSEVIKSIDKYNIIEEKSPDNQEDYYNLINRFCFIAEESERLKKKLRDDGDSASWGLQSGIPPAKLANLRSELGDVLWYINKESHSLYSSLEAIANVNLDKVESRLKRGKIHGSGGDR